MVQMSAIRYPVKMVGGMPVVRLPAKIDVTNAGALSAALLAVPGRGQATLVVNMKRTHSCDSAGLHVLVRAQERAVAEGGELRLVIRNAGLLRTFAVAGVDQMFPIFSRLRQALDPPSPLVAAGIGTGPAPGG
jgi:anti-sigma B factor antagonist